MTNTAFKWSFNHWQATATSMLKCPMLKMRSTERVARLHPQTFPFPVAVMKILPSLLLSLGQPESPRTERPFSDWSEYTSLIHQAQVFIEELHSL
jgi:hypothetical protein